uniref:RNA-directed DNA polymerase (Reverse) n=1 Tax=Haemonchus contortus TaxID=6289 RepID=W6NGJ2_HAECO
MNSSYELSLIGLSREYDMPLYLTFIDLKKAFDTVETEAVIEALGYQGVPTRYVRILRELYNNFTTRTYTRSHLKEVIINMKRGVRQGDTVSPKHFSAALENVMLHMEWESMGVEVYSQYLRFADEIVLFTPNIHPAGGTNAGRIRQRLRKDRITTEPNEEKFMKNGLVPDAPFTLNGRNISEYSSYVYLGREVIKINDLAPELRRRKRVAWGVFKNIEGVVKKAKSVRIPVHLFDIAVLSVLHSPQRLGL